MEITLAKSAGFCFGVSRAVKLVEELMERGEKVYMLGPLIHNPAFVSGLERRGARVIDAPSQAPQGAYVVIRSHGVGPEVISEINSRGLRCCDATCPNVARIHRIAADAAASGAPLIIGGDPDHPEVQGIRGFAGVSYVFRNRQELEKITSEHPEIRETEPVFVAQTTFNAEEWDICREFTRKVYTKAIIFDTICSATSIRQQEARKLAKNSDIMIVVGGRQSSNTQKLTSICSEFCPSFLVEGADNLPAELLKHAARVGVTAGASTPVCIIKEVLNTMSGLDNVEAEDVDFAAALEQSIKTLRTDERVKGVVAAVEPNEIQVDLGTKHAGYVPLSELTDDPSLKPDQIVKVGDEIDLLVLRVNDQDGTVMLSKKRVDAMHNWDVIVKASEDNTTLSGVVTDAIKGGLLVSVGGVKLFVPASLSGVPRGGELDSMLRQNVNLKVIEINEDRRRAVGSIRAVAREERKALADKFWDEVEVGSEYTGTVKSMTSYGAFVDLGGVDGMIHVSELSWSHIKNPAEVLSIGQKVEVAVKNVDREKKKVSLSYKGKGEDPWFKFVRDYAVGDIIDVKIVSFMPFGSFAQIIPGVDGLIHISQISDARIARPQDALEMGQTVKVKIIDIDTDRRRISLSMKEAGAAVPADEVQEAQPQESQPQESEAKAEAKAEEPAAEAKPEEAAAPETDKA
jgi:ribosomal protein S1/(E)-4-hydroxy-3-methyl-but-2-enyl pyrophosphate reductase